MHCALRLIFLENTYFTANKNKQFCSKTFSDHLEEDKNPGIDDSDDDDWQDELEHSGEYGVPEDIRGC